MSLYVAVIKGSVADAEAALAARDLVGIGLRYQPQWSNTRCMIVTNFKSDATKVCAWFCETNADTAFPSGSLLYYSEATL